MKRTTYPCKGCTDRYVGCHSKCEKYIKAKENRTEALKERDKNQKINDTIYDLKYNRMKSLKQGHK